MISCFQLLMQNGTLCFLKSSFVSKINFKPFRYRLISLHLQTEKLFNEKRITTYILFNLFKFDFSKHADILKF